jgi:hypothetical protein
VHLDSSESSSTGHKNRAHNPSSLFAVDNPPNAWKLAARIHRAVLFGRLYCPPEQLPRVPQPPVVGFLESGVPTPHCGWLRTRMPSNDSVPPSRASNGHGERWTNGKQHCGLKRFGGKSRRSKERIASTRPTLLTPWQLLPNMKNGSDDYRRS